MFERSPPFDGSNNEEGMTLLVVVWASWSALEFGVDTGGCNFGVGVVLAMVCGGQYPLVVATAVILVRKKE